jgi:flagellar biosynthesis/type III secretory pathway M-ring protein FliF/YscJ
LNAFLGWAVPAVLVLIGWLAAWLVARKVKADQKEAEARSQAYAKGRADELEAHNKSALRALHSRIDRIERHTRQHREFMLKNGWITPATLTGIPEVDDQ